MRYEITCEVDVPDCIGVNVTEKQVEDWARFNLNENGELRDNPLQDIEFKAMDFSVRVRACRRRATA